MAVILMSLVVAAIGLPFMTRYLADDLPHDTGKDDIGAVMTEVAINRLNALLDEPVEDPSEQALRADAGNMLLETYQRRLHYNDNDEGQDVGLELAKRARLEKYMQRSLSPSVRSCSGCAAPITSAISLFMRCCGMNLKEEFTLKPQSPEVAIRLSGRGSTGAEKQKKSLLESRLFYSLAPLTGLEPVTYGLTVRRSTD